ncbi:MAG: hypothetical protein IKK75_08690 [Clostridia bacterium]|nr:hypothetical protein [Clostridia bacterium]
MNGKSNNWNKHFNTLTMILGVASFLFGLLSFLFWKPEDGSLPTLLGMFTGFGAGVMAVAIVRTIRARVISREKLEQEEIEKWDERNIAITRASGMVAYYASILLMGVLIFLFMGLGYTVPAYACLAGMYVLVGVFLIARKVLEKKM